MNEIEKAKAQLRELLRQGYINGGNFDHGAKVRRLKAYILTSLEELEMFGNVSTKCPLIHSGE